MKIELRKFKLEDMEKVTKLFANDNVLDKMIVCIKSKDVTLEGETKWLKGALEEYKKEKPEFYPLVITFDKEIIGGIELIKINWEHENAEIGYWIGEDYWGKGYATQAVKQFIKEIFKKFKLKRIEASTFSFNKASQKILEKAGFKYEGERRSARKKNGKFYDDKLYALVK